VIGTVQAWEEDRSTERTTASKLDEFNDLRKNCQKKKQKNQRRNTFYSLLQSSQRMPTPQNRMSPASNSYFYLFSKELKRIVGM
jgi:uncharacterized lipoprotein YddW (UPF0748 family)